MTPDAWRLAPRASRPAPQHQPLPTGQRKLRNILTHAIGAAAATIRLIAENHSSLVWLQVWLIGMPLVENWPGIGA